MFKPLAQSLLARFHDAARDLRLAGEGLCHIRQASPAVQNRARRDFAACATETGLAVARDIAPEVSLAVTVIQTAEKIADLPPEERDVKTLAIDFAESLAPEAIAAAHSAADLALDLEEAGLEWEARKKRELPQPLPR